uniref:Uncharacterized protein n=1 Tax=Kalanchoe fedtschenkoi TaxID=63787 RepID=A0A7N0UFR8_KALFE
MIMASASTLVDFSAFCAGSAGYNKHFQRRNQYQLPTTKSSSTKSSLVVKLEFQPPVVEGYQFRRFGGVLRASSYEDAPVEIVEDGKFVPLTAEDPQYGPPALLLLGFKLEEAPKIEQFLKDMEGDFLNIIYCTEDMINRSLWEAVNTRQENLQKVKVAKSLPRICFLSGLTGEEMIMFMDAFSETGLEPAVFAALVPNSANKPLQELIDEVMRDHEMVSGKSEISAELLT